MTENNDYQAVDFGLPSGIKWADRNIGASRPEDAGKYFAWGDVEGYRAEDIKGNMFTKKWYNKRNASMISKDIDIASQNDVANIEIGGRWRIPSKADFIELLNHTRREICEVNSVSGIRFISNTDNTKSIFMPFAGIAIDGSIDSIGEWLNYWSSSIGKYSDDAWSLNCDMEGVESHMEYNCCRYYGFSIRGVTK